MNALCAVVNALAAGAFWVLAASDGGLYWLSAACFTFAAIGWLVSALAEDRR